MRIILAPVLAFTAVALARAVPEHIASDHIVLEQTLAEVPAPIAEYSSIAFKAANGSNVVIHVAPGVFMTDDVSKLPNDIGKQFKIKKVPKLMELCTVRASQKDNGDKGTPRRDDCQALYDYCHSHPVYFYFDNKIDLNRWAEVAFVGSCAYRTRTVHHNVVFSTGDMANFLDRSLSRKAWTDKGRMSASGEADCTVYEGDSGFAPVFWRLQQRGPLDEPAFNLGNDTFIPNNTTSLETRGRKREAPLIVHSLDEIPRHTSAFITNGNAHAINTTNIGLSSDIPTKDKRFDLTLDGPAEGPYCDAKWLSADWKEPNRPFRKDCQNLFDFLKTNTAKVVVFDREANRMVKFTAHETCAVGFTSLSKTNITFTNLDTANFVERMLLWDGAQFESDYTIGKMGGMCGSEKETHVKYESEFALVYRDPELAGKGHVDPPEDSKRDVISAIPAPEIMEKGAMMVKSGSPEDLAATAEIASIPSDTDPSLNWVDYTVIDSNGVNITAQLNANLLHGPLAHSKALGTRLERVDTPLGPSKRCTGKIQFWGGAKPDSPLIADCEKLRNFMSVRRFRFRFNKDEINSGNATPLAKVGSCRIAWLPWGSDITVGNMDLDILLTKALKLYDPSQTQMRLWGWEYCDNDGQFGVKNRIKFYIF
ncbi:hypothetical protein BDP81DRAFT_464553 [Colletotrichum phormii]|uniref:Ecp2 effector protein-like domain-containing protein n=1 Tax=Colletotrichum phormii TaxID=359342 RepID=A0AAI9ZH46_9PEZI|nr:uncharacterized protein BDP81DRAFT_464553 [Colletotrichum phormii]KAK1624371.1 hypothetical protein BDP81DRAFT_464553 [Colletotrichum phormii]